MKLPQVFTGIVVHGYGRGHKTVGFATANLDTKSWTEDTTEADFGVYCGIVHLNGHDPLIGIVSIGKNPTFGEIKPTFEVHILGFDQDIYGVEMVVDLKQHMRPMIAFKSVDQLKEQIGKDAATAKKEMEILMKSEFKA